MTFLFGYVVCNIRAKDYFWLSFFIILP
jgi:hypothetical protein